MHARSFAVAALTVSLTLAACGRSASPDELKALQAGLGKISGDKMLRDEMHAFYGGRRFRPVFVVRGEARPVARHLLDVLRAAGQEGLDPAQYRVDELARRIDKPGDGAQAMETELALTRALLTYGNHVAFGHRIAKDVDASWTAQPRKIDVATLAAEAADGDDLDELTAKLEPKQPQYAQLKQALANEKDAERAEKLRLNLERWRWLPDDLGKTYVMANVPSFHLEVHDGDERPLQMRVIVGKPENRTPIFSDTMTEVVFSPYWNIPQSIEVKEMLPSLQKDSDFLKRKDIEVVRIVNGKAEQVDPEKVDWDKAAESDIQLRQRPGADNALGFIKFVFPNRHNVYFHDTPNDNLFAKLTRDLSHGCVRLEKPVDLARFVLRDQSEWTPERIEEAMHSGKEKHVALKEPVAVHIVYFTALPADNGGIAFFDDVYGYDARQRELTQVARR
ncbi:MAG TPA: L,D-transpeptidase family protein [Nevskiaceae bacterium]|nr:L,D-transpeptidase family protein [Nevskiaceae bacterium]